MYNSNNFSGIGGNKGENQGNPVTVMIHDNQWRGMEELMDLRRNEIDKEDGLVDAKVIMDELGISKKTLSNLVSSGKISKDMYTVAVNGIKKYDFNKIMGVRK